MRNRKRLIWILTAVLMVIPVCCLCGCGDKSAEEDAPAAVQETTPARDYSKVWEMGGPEDMPLNAEEYHKTWDDLVDEEMVDRTLLGYPSNGDENYPVYLYHMDINESYVDEHYNVQDGELYERPKILVTSGFHGAEKAAPVFLNNLIHDMKEDPEFAEIAVKFEWDIIPLVNPWGYSHSMLKNGVLQNGFEHDSLSGYDIVENGEYNQGIRLNADGLDINRDWYDSAGGCPSEEAKLVREVFVNGDYDIVLDLHETQNDKACGFASMQMKPDYMSEKEYEADSAAFYEAVSQAGIVTDKLINKLYGLDEDHQATYPWDGSDHATFRNYTAGYTNGGERKIDHNNKPKYSICVEVSIYCGDYAGDSAESFNEASNTYGNTFLHYFVKQLDGLL